MPQIIPIKELKNTAEISDMCRYKKWLWRYGYYEYGELRKYHESNSDVS